MGPARRLHLFAALASALFALGCASARSPLADADIVRDLRAQGVDTSSLVIPWEVTDEMKAWVRSKVSEDLPKPRRLEALLAAITGSTGLGLKYKGGYTGTAREAFESHEANCLAFSSLFVGLAREIGVSAFFVDVNDVEKFEKAGDLVVVSGHTSAGFDPGDGILILDFSPEERPDYRQVQRLSDRTALALFHSNRGAELLRGGLGDEALRWLRQAVAIDPELAGAWVNLGVALRRAGDTEAAESSYRRALEINPEEASAYQNLAALLSLRGRHAEARELLALATRMGKRNPYSYLALGDLSLAYGRLDEARRLFRRALHLDRKNPEAYAALGMAALVQGNRVEARKWLRKAEALDQENARVRQLAGRLHLAEGRV
jgi:Flp pilus assembly protein TadD